MTAIFQQWKGKAMRIMDDPVFQPLRDYYGETFSNHDVKEVLGNLSGFFAVLHEWSAKKPIAVTTTMETTIRGAKRKRTVSRKPNSPVEIRCFYYSRLVKRLINKSAPAPGQVQSSVYRVSAVHTRQRHQFEYRGS
jgi:hypothetical protein